MAISFKNIFNASESGFGLEIENGSLKAFWLQKKRKGYEMRACCHQRLPKGIVVSEQVIDVKGLAAEIKKCLKNARPKPIWNEYVVFSIPETKTFIRTISIPAMTDKEAGEAVKWETEANIPVSIDKVYLDWQVIGGQVEEKEEVLVTAIPRDIMNGYVEAVRLAELIPKAAEVDVIASTRALSNRAQPEETILIADIGADKTSLAISRGQVPYFTSSLPLSGHTFTESIVKEMGVGSDVAEEIKMRFGLGKVKQDAMLQKVFQPIIENLAAEIEKSIGFYSESIRPGDKISKIVLSGGGALLRGLTETLSEKIKREAVLGDPLANIRPLKVPQNFSPCELVTYTTSVGLAIRACEYED